MSSSLAENDRWRGTSRMSGKLFQLTVFEIFFSSTSIHVGNFLFSRVTDGSISAFARVDLVLEHGY